jgi:hypothetical protein
VIGDGESYVVRVQKGKTSSEVYAESSEDWVFIEWSDGYQYPARSEKNVGKALSLKALFSEITGSAGNGAVQDMPTDLPPQESQDGKPSKPQPGKPNDTAGGKYSPESNYIIDNNTHYGNEWEESYNKAQEELKEPNISKEQADITDLFFNGIEAKKESEEEGK